MRSNKNKSNLVSKRPSIVIFDEDESNISNEILSEGSQIHELKVIEKLEQNMNNLPFNKNHLNLNDKLRQHDFDDHLEMNLLNWVQRNKKSQTAFNNTKRESLLPICSKKEESKGNNIFMKENTQTHTTLTLKSEISNMLKMLARNRRLSYELDLSNLNTFQNKISNVDRRDAKRFFNETRNESPVRIWSKRDDIILFPFELTVEDLEPAIQ